MSLPAAKGPASCNVANLSSMLQEPIQKLRRVTAPIEKEMLSVVFGLTGFHTSTYGRHVTLNNDHNTKYCNTKATRGGESHSTSENAVPNYGM